MNHDLNLAISNACQLTEIRVMLAAATDVALFFKYLPKEQTCLLGIIADVTVHQVTVAPVDHGGCTKNSSTFKKSTQVLESSLQQQSVENRDVENCTKHSENNGVCGSLSSSALPSTYNDKQLSETCSANRPLSTVKSVYTAVCSSKVQSAHQSQHSETEQNTSGNVEFVAAGRRQLNDVASNKHVLYYMIYCIARGNGGSTGRLGLVSRAGGGTTLL